MTAMTFSSPAVRVEREADHHSAAAAANARVANEATELLRTALGGTADVSTILVKAAAGAGKSYVLRRLVADAAAHASTERVAVTAFTNRQVIPLAVNLGDTIGKDRVCLFIAKDRMPEITQDIRNRVTVVAETKSLPHDAEVIVATASKFGSFSMARNLRNHYGADYGEPIFDALFVDEAWQLANHLFDPIRNFAPVTVGVGDVGQLPPIEIGTNPWRGDSGYNPYRAWPNEVSGADGTSELELPAVWRPTAEQLPLWRAFYPEWSELTCVPAPGDRSIETDTITDAFAAEVWEQVATGEPTFLEVDGLPEAEAADIDTPLIALVERLLDAWLTANPELVRATYSSDGSPESIERITAADSADDPLVVILSTRNQAVDDAETVAERLRAKHGLGDGSIVASTVDSWQGQTNGVTIAIHPLNGATKLDEFNSSFGRLAVICTRATHGLLLLARAGIDDLLQDAPAMPGTPFGEPGNRQLPRQTHTRILNAFARGTITDAGTLINATEEAAPIGTYQ